MLYLTTPKYFDSFKQEFLKKYVKLKINQFWKLFQLDQVGQESNYNWIFDSGGHRYIYCQSKCTLKFFISLSIESYEGKCENESKSLSLDLKMIENSSCELSTVTNTEKSSIINWVTLM